MRIRNNEVMILASCAIWFWSIVVVGQQPDHNRHPINLARALLDGSLVIGLFEFTEPSKRDAEWYRLRGGMSVRDQPSYPSAGKGWHIMRTIKPIKGDMDDLVFFKAFPSFSRNDVFAPEFGSRWILVLKRVLNSDNGLVSADGLYSDVELGAYPMLKRDTLFDLYDYTGGALYIGGTNGVAGAGEAKGYPESMADELSVMGAILQSSSNPKEEILALTHQSSAAQEVIRELVALIDAAPSRGISGEP